MVRIEALALRRPGLAIALLAATLTPPAGLRAQDSLALDATVSAVVSGGAWDQGPTHGSFRLVVVRGRTPSDTSWLYVQWLQDDPNRSWVLGTRVVAGLGGGTWSLEAPSIGRGPTGGWVARIGGEDPRTGTRALWIIPLGSPGALTLARRY